jgi:hypothetical protein
MPPRGRTHHVSPHRRAASLRRGITETPARTDLQPQRHPRSGPTVGPVNEGGTSSGLGTHSVGLLGRSGSLSRSGPPSLSEARAGGIPQLTSRKATVNGRSVQVQVGCGRRWGHGC